MTIPLLSEHAGLAALEQRLAQDLAWLDLPSKPWVPQGSVDGQELLDVVIIGGGMAGMATAVALQHMGVRARIFDSAVRGFEGPWATTARMETLRSPKQLTGPALGLPALTFRAWFEAQYGQQAWDALDKIPRLQWMAYLHWYRKVMKLDIQNEHYVKNIIPHAHHVALQIQTASGETRVYARRVVLATGRAGLGGAYIPGFVQNIRRELWAHSSDAADYSALRGRRVGVVGAGASAMDSAGTALENGAARVDLLIRRADLPRVNKGKGASNAGFTCGYLGLPDAWKWRLRHYINEQQVPPPQASVRRVSQHANAYFNFGSPVLNVIEKDGHLQIETPKKNFELDFLILATGFFVDWHARPEYATIAHHVRVWADRYQPGAGQEDRELEGAPDLGVNFEFQEKPGNPLPGLSRVHCFCYPATLTHGTVSGDIPAISDGAERVSKGIARLLFIENIDQHFSDLQAFDEPEIVGDEWTAAA
ncbi:MAG: NAD(P)/FAD-dependent oxidoreductase [Paralcaligenes sp.]